MTRFKRVSAYTSGGLLRANYGLQSVGKKRKKKVMQARRLLRKPKPAQLAGPDRPAQTLGRGFFFWAAARPSSLGPASGPAQFTWAGRGRPSSLGHWPSSPAHCEAARAAAARRFQVRYAGEIVRQMNSSTFDVNFCHQKVSMKAPCLVGSY